MRSIGASMSKPLTVGDWVECRLYNTPDRRFYGDCFTAVIVEIVPTRGYPHYGYGPFGKNYTVRRQDDTTIVLHRNEIKRRVVPK